MMNYFFLVFLSLLSNIKLCKHAKLSFSTVFIDLQGNVYSDETKTTLVSARDNSIDFILENNVHTIFGGSTTIGAFYMCRKTIKTFSVTPDEKTISDKSLNANIKDENIKTDEKIVKVSGTNTVLRKIEGYAFNGCILLKLLDFSNCVNLEDIEFGAFLSCSGLTDLILPPCLKICSSMMAGYCVSLKTIQIPKSVVKIEGYSATLNIEGCFSYCSSLTDVIFEDFSESSLTSLGHLSFSNCTSLTSISFPKKLKTIENGNAFRFCENLREIKIDPENIYYQSFDKGVVYTKNGESLILFPTNYDYELTPQNSYSIREGTKIIESPFWTNNKIKEIIIPGSVEEIKGNAFSFTSLSKVEIKSPSNLTYFRGNSFFSNKELLELNIPPSVTTIEGGAFSSCPKLKLKIDPNSNFRFENDFLYENNNAWALGYFGNGQNVVFPDSITYIGVFVFNGVEDLVELSLPQRITSIGYGGISENKKLKKISILSNNCDFGDVSISANPMLEQVQMPLLFSSAVISFGMFQFCKSLASFTIPIGVSTISGSAFEQCGLKTIDFSRNTNLYLISSKAFKQCKYLETLILPTSVNKIEIGAFELCGMKEISFQNGHSSLTSISDQNFVSCFNLIKINFPPEVTTIESNSFYNCCALNEIVFPSSISTIRYNAFGSCTNLEKISFIGEGLNLVEGGAFVGCMNLAEMEINNTKFLFEENVLYDNQKKNIILYLPASKAIQYRVPETVENITAHAFEYARNLVSIEIPNGNSVDGSNSKIKYLHFRCFKDCIGLSSLWLPSSIVEIGFEAFKGTSLTKCGSIKCDKSLHDQLKAALVDEVAFNECPPTSVFTQNINLFRNSLLFLSKISILAFLISN